MTGPNGQKTKAAFVGYDHATGFGILRAESPLDVEPMKFGSASELKEGAPVIVAGHGGLEAAIGARVVARGARAITLTGREEPWFEEVTRAELALHAVTSCQRDLQRCLVEGGSGAASERRRHDHRRCVVAAPGGTYRTVQKIRLITHWL